MNDSPVDIGIQTNPGNAVTPVVGKPLADRRPRRCSSITSGTTSFTSAVGYSRQDIDNTDGAGAERVQGRPVRARQPALLRRCRT